RVGTPICPNDGTKITSQSAQQMVDAILKLDDGTKLQILSPVVRAKRGQHKKALTQIKKQGYVRVRVDGETRDIGEDIELDKNKKHDIDVVVDRIVINDHIKSRLFDSVEAALRLSDGYMNVDVIGQDMMVFSEKNACPLCGFTVGELEPRLFSFNAPFGACDNCDGLGMKLEVDMDLVIPDPSKTLAEGAIIPWNPISSQYYPEMLAQAAKEFKIDMNTPFEKLPQKDQDIVLNGSDGKTFHFHYENDFGSVRDVDVPFEGVIPNINRRYHETNSDFTREVMRKYMTELTCPVCHGKRLNRQALAVKISGKDIAEVSDMSIKDELPFFKAITLGEQNTVIAKPILKE
ncbi:excinuclease ABC subunit UvrA, partial [Clostridium botulinum]|nr:excinuclease ABC subunit UvrA [Clostridium botulinum]